MPDLGGRSGGRSLGSGGRSVRGGGSVRAGAAAPLVREASGPVAALAEAAAARSIPIAWRTSGRSKNRSIPRTWNGTPACANACSKRSVWTLTRTSTAISRGGTPDAMSSAARAATAAASAASSA